MPPRPFPFHINIGTDICSTPRIYRAIFGSGSPSASSLDLTRLDRFSKKVFTSPEWLIMKHRFPLFFPKVQVSGKKEKDEARRPRVLHWGEVGEEERAREMTRLATFLAGRWAGKEAAIKACKPHKCTLRSVMILAQKGNKAPLCIIAPPNQSWTTAVPDLLKYNEEPGKPTYFTYDLSKVQGQIARLSISHDSDYATAVCMAEMGPVEGDVGGEAEARGL